MPPALVVTPGDPDANAFVDLDTFFTYLDGRLNASDVTEMDPDDQTRAILEATRELSLVAWLGIRATTGQVLSWPRTHVRDPDDPTGAQFPADRIPQRVRDATCELALQFLKAGTTDRRSADPTLEVVSETVDVLETVYVDPSRRTRGVERFPRVIAWIGPLLATSTGGLTMVRT